MCVSCLSHFLGRVSKSSLGYRRVLAYASKKNVNDPVINLRTVILYHPINTTVLISCVWFLFSIEQKPNIRTSSIYLCSSDSKKDTRLIIIHSGAISPKVSQSN